MTETLITAIDAESAARILRHVDPTEALEAGILTPMAGTRAIRIFGLEEIERFLVLHDGKTVAMGGAWATVNYVDPDQLATWIGDVLGDAELSASVRAIAASRKPYGFLVPELKRVIAERVEECTNAINAETSAAGSL